MTEPEPAPAPPRPSTWRDRIDLLTQPPPLTASRVAYAVLGVVGVLGVGWFLLRPPPGPPAEELLPLASATSTSSTTATSEATTLIVHAAGAVISPGVYEVPSGARVMDVIDAAGGPTADADVDRLNLAAPVADGERVYVPRVGEPGPAPPIGGAAAPAAAGPLDLNTATLEQLDALPGIGPTTAQAILDERERRGGFRSVDDLLDVRGIGDAKLEAIRDLVTV